MRRLRLSVVALLLLMTMLLAACTSSKTPSSPGTPSGDPIKGGTLTVGVATEPNTTDVYQISWSGGLQNMYQSLITRDHSYSYADGLAEKWESSADGLTWTFHLKKGVKFHDGTPFNAEAVKQHFDVMRDPKTAAGQEAEWVWFDSMKVVDEHTIQFILSKPFPNAEFRHSNTYGAIQSPTAYAKHGPAGDNTYGTLAGVGTGPFMLEEYISGDKLVMKRNPDFTWGPSWATNQGPAHVDSVVWKLIPEASTRLTELETGGIQMLVDLPVEHFDRAKSIPGVEVFERPGFGLGYLDFRKDKAPFNDVRVRQAINLAIDREAIVKSIFFGRAQVATGLIPPELSSFHGDKEAHSLNVEKAKQLLSDANFDTTQKIQLMTRNRTEHTRVAEVLEQMLKAVGITVEIVQFDNAGYKAKQVSGDWQLSVNQYSWDDPDILGWFLYGEMAPSPNTSGWLDAKTDELFLAAEGAPSAAARDAKYKDLQKHLIEQAAWAPIWFPMNYDAVRTDLVKGYKVHPSSSSSYLGDIWLTGK